MSEAKKGCGRPRARPLPVGVTVEQINALVGMTATGKRAAILVLVHGQSTGAAAKATGMSSSGVSNVVQRCAKALELARVAAGVTQIETVSTTESAS